MGCFGSKSEVQAANDIEDEKAVDMERAPAPSSANTAGAKTSPGAKTAPGANTVPTAAAPAPPAAPPPQRTMTSDHRAFEKPPQLSVSTSQMLSESGKTPVRKSERGARTPQKEDRPDLITVHANKSRPPPQKRPQGSEKKKEALTKLSKLKPVPTPKANATQSPKAQTEHNLTPDAQAEALPPNLGRVKSSDKVACHQAVLDSLLNSSALEVAAPVVALRMLLEGIDLVQLNAGAVEALKAVTVDQVAHIAGVEPEKVQDMSGQLGSVTVSAGSIVVDAKVFLSKTQSVSQVNAAFANPEARGGMLKAVGQIPAVAAALQSGRSLEMTQSIVEEKPCVLSPERSRELLCRISWYAQAARTRVVHLSAVTEACDGNEDEAKAVFEVASSGRLELLELAPRTPNAVQICHESLQVLLCGKAMSARVREAQADGLAALAREFQSLAENDVWGPVFVAAYEILVQDSGPELAAVWVDQLVLLGQKAATVLLHAAVEDSCDPFAETLLATEEGKKLINESDNQGWPPLLKAASAGDLDLCKLLFANGADPELRGRLIPSLEVLRGKPADIWEEDCIVDCGDNAEDQFVLALPAAILDDVNGAWMYEVTLDREPLMSRSAELVSFEVDEDFGDVKTEYELEWHELSVGWLQADLAEKFVGPQQPMGFHCLLGRGHGSLGLSADGRCRWGADVFRQKFAKHCGNQVVKQRMSHLKSSGEAATPEPLPHLLDIEKEGEALMDDWEEGDVIGVVIAPSPAGRRFLFGLNGNWIEVTYKDGGARESADGLLVPAISSVRSASRFRVNFGQRRFEHEPPADVADVRPVCVSGSGDSAVLVAACTGRKDIVELFMPAIRHADEADRRHNRTLLHWAAWWGWGDIAKEMILAGAEVSRVDASGRGAPRIAFRGWCAKQSDEHMKILASFPLAELYWEDLAPTVVDVSYGLTEQELFIPAAEAGGFSTVNLTSSNIEEARQLLSFHAKVPGSAAPNMRRVQVDRVELSDELVDTILAFAPEPEIVQFSHCSAGPEIAGKVLARLLTLTPRLRELQLWCCGLRGLAITTLAQHVQQPHELEELRWRGDRLQGKQEVGATAATLVDLCNRQFPNLHYLGLRDSGIRRDQLDDLADGVKLWL